MPSKRKPSRTAQLQPQPAPSDYDTDNANLTDNQHLLAASIPAPPVRSINELNLLVLQRWYPEVTHIIAIAPYAVIYNLNRAVGEWEKGETEGSMFVCQLTQEPYERYRIIILNRKSVENFTLDLVSSENVSFQSGFIIAQTTEDDATGIWIYSDGRTTPTTAEVTWNVIESCAKRVEQFAVHDRGISDETGDHEDIYESGVDAVAEDDTLQNVSQQVLPPVMAASGERLDLAALFAKPRDQQQAVPDSNQSFVQPDFFSIGQVPITARSNGHSSHFPATADTDFFRTTSTPADPQPSHAGPVAQQNALLDLFKSARK